VEIQIDNPAEVTQELVEALGKLIPQFNPALPVPTAEHLATLLADPAATLLVARDGNRIVGTAMVIVYPTTIRFESRIEDVVVDESARGRGARRSSTRASRSRAAAAPASSSSRRRVSARQPIVSTSAWVSSAATAIPTG